MEAAVLKDPTSEEVRGGNHPHIPREKRVRKNLENAGQVLTRPSSNAYSLGWYLPVGLVELGKPLGDVFSQRLVSRVRPA